MTLSIQLPLSEHDARQLRAGDQVYLNGTIWTGRDAAHKRLIATLDAGEPLPIQLHDQILYFVGPSPARPGNVIGAAGPTTSGRMDKWSPRLILECGLRGMIGKGNRNAAVIDAMKTKGCVYFAAIGGAGALLAKSIVKCECFCYEDLGTEAIHKLEVNDFPVIVAIDTEGNTLYTDAPSD